MKSSKGFTIIELVIVLAVVLIAVSIGSSVIWNNRGATEERAYKGGSDFVMKNGIQKKRMTCAGDSDGDGYGTCTIATVDGEIITLECPTDFVNTNLWGATSCKEIPVMRMQGLTGRVR